MSVYIDRGDPFKRELIRTTFLRNKQMWSAHVTWRGVDIAEYGETRLNAIHFLLKNHSDWFSKHSKE